MNLLNIIILPSEFDFFYREKSLSLHVSKF